MDGQAALVTMERAADAAGPGLHFEGAAGVGDGEVIAGERAHGQRVGRADSGGDGWHAGATAHVAVRLQRRHRALDFPVGGRGRSLRGCTVVRDVIRADWRRTEPAIVPTKQVHCPLWTRAGVHRVQNNGGVCRAGDPERRGGRLAASAGNQQCRENQPRGCVPVLLAPLLHRVYGQVSL